MSFKNHLPNESVLHMRLTNEWNDYHTEVEEVLTPLQEQYKTAKQEKFLLRGFGYGSRNFRYTPEEIIGIIYQYEQTFKELLFKKVLELYELTGSYIRPTLPASDSQAVAEVLPQLGPAQNHPFSTSLVSLTSARKQRSLSPEYEQTHARLDHSELVTEARNRTIVGEMYSIDWNDRVLYLCELDITHQPFSGDSATVKHIFSGYFFSFDMPQSVNGKTFVSTEGDTRGFGNLSFFNSVKNDVRAMQLEWNQFENKLHVASNDPTSARYILTPDFMVDLYDWWKGKKKNIRLSFIESRMYMLFPDEREDFVTGVIQLDEDTLWQQTYNLAAPLLHILHLVEDVELLRK